MERIQTHPARRGHHRATAVEYLAGRHLYKASHCAPDLSPSERRHLRRTMRVRKEVIVAGGTFNSPQLLMLSGIGPRHHLHSLGIRSKVDLPGVGSNLQDHYETSVVTEHATPFAASERCTFTGDADDPCAIEWRRAADRTATVYGTNGVLGGIRRRWSGASRERAELIVFGGPTRFEGYVPGWDRIAGADRNHYT